MFDAILSGPHSNSDYLWSTIVSRRDVVSA